jgi:ATP-binding protein involved in chromosome partitioning
MTVTEEGILQALKPIEDPDLRRSIVDLGFIRDIEIEAGTVKFNLVLTTPACPVRDQLKEACESAVSALPGVDRVLVELKAETRGAPLAGRKVLTTVRNILAVASGKGGVAKSTTAVNLAVSLSQSGARVGVLDADIYGPSLPTMLSVESEPGMGPENQLIPATTREGIKVISIGFFMPPGRAAILRGPMVSGYVTQFLGNVQWGELDYLVVDYPPGTGDVQLTLSQQAAVTAAVICTTPQEIALMDVRKAIAMFETTKIPVLGVVETMSHFVCDGCGKQHAIFGQGGGQQVAEAAKVPLLGQVPIDPRIVSGGDSGRAVVAEHPESAAAQAYRAIAGAVAAKLSTLNVEHEGAVENFSLAWNA